MEIFHEVNEVLNRGLESHRSLVAQSHPEKEIPLQAEAESPDQNNLGLYPAANSIA